MYIKATICFGIDKLMLKKIKGRSVLVNAYEGTLMMVRSSIQVGKRLPAAADRGGWEARQQNGVRQMNFELRKSMFRCMNEGTLGPGCVISQSSPESF